METCSAFSWSAVFAVYRSTPFIADSSAATAASTLACVASWSAATALAAAIAPARASRLDLVQSAESTFSASATLAFSASLVTVPGSSILVADRSYTFHHLEVWAKLVMRTALTVAAESSVKICFWLPFTSPILVQLPSASWYSILPLTIVSPPFSAWMKRNSLALRASA